MVASSLEDARASLQQQEAAAHALVRHTHTHVEVFDTHLVGLCICWECPHAKQVVQWCSGAGHVVTRVLVM